MASSQSAAMGSTGRARSCTSCRQVKLSCDAKQTFPAACSRCKSNKLDCRMDSTFRRTPIRRRLAEVTNELHNIQNVLTMENNLASVTTLPLNLRAQLELPEVPGFPKYSASPSSSGQRGGLANETWFDPAKPDDDGMAARSWAIGVVSLEKETVADLFRHFDRYYFRHLPILEKVTSLSAMYNSSSILFWTIILVSSQWHPIHSRHYAQLVTPHQTLLSTFLHTAIEKVQTVHALLVLSLWPIPKLRQSDDPSWNYCGLAINAALQMGLHQSGTRYQIIYGDGFFDARKPKTEIGTMTWMACFSVSTRLSSFLGLPPHLCSAPQLDVIASLCNEVGISREFAAQTEIQRHIARYTTALDGKTDSRTQLSLIQLFDREIDGVRTSFLDAWSLDVEISFQSAKLYLYAFCFVPEGSLVPGDVVALDTSVSFKVILHSGLAAAIRLIYAFSELGSQEDGAVGSEDGSTSLLIYPKPYYTSVFFAAVFLLKFLSTDPQASQSDKDLAMNHVGIAHRLFLSFDHSREHSRAAKLIELLGRMTKSGGGRADVHIRGRYGASLIYDAIWTAHQIRHRTLSREKDREQWTEYADMGGLPPAPVSVDQTDLQHSVSPDESLEQIPEQQADPDWTFPWGIWDDQLFDALQLDMNMNTME